MTAPGNVFGALFVSAFFILCPIVAIGWGIHFAVKGLRRLRRQP